MRYLEIVLKEDMERDGGIDVASRKNATRFEPLRSIAFPANNGHLDSTEDVVITYRDGSTDRVRGHVLETGVSDE